MYATDIENFNGAKQAFIKLNSAGYASIYKTEEKIYTEDEVLKIVKQASAYFFSQGIKEGRPYSNGGDTDYLKWFNNNVLKQNT
jgi:hypothetical protein